MKRRNFLQIGALGGVAGGLMYPLSSLSQNRSEQEFVKEDQREISVSGEYDVVVSGAGPAGVMAAIEAGRSGAKVLLIEIRGCLGGVWTSGLLSWILDQSNKPDRKSVV